MFKNHILSEFILLFSVRIVIKTIQTYLFVNYWYAVSTITIFFNLKKIGFIVANTSRMIIMTQNERNCVIACQVQDKLRKVLKVSLVLDVLDNKV